MPIIIPDQRSVPVAEQEKMSIKEKRDACYDLLRMVRYYKSMRIHNMPAINDFRSAVFDLFDYINPKIKDHINTLRTKKDKKDIQDRAQEWEDLVEYMKFFKDKTFIITLGDMIQILNFINEFCEEYGITRVTVRSMTHQDFQ